MFEQSLDCLQVFYNRGKDKNGKRLSQPLGSLSRHGREYTFSYCDTAPIDVSVTMPRRQRHYKFGALHPIFQMHLPQGLSRDLLNHVQNKATGLGDLQVLLSLTENYSRLIFSREAGEDAEASAMFAELIGKYTVSSTQARTQQFVNSSIVGKSALPSMFYVIKSWGSEYPELACNEYACLQAARGFGIPTVEATLTDKGKTLVVNRFDAPAKDSEPLLGFEDFCTLQGKLPHERYASSYELCAKTIRQFVSPSQQNTALCHFFKILLLSTVIRNGDAHLKNFGIVYQEGGERTLAPCFDLNTTTVYLANDCMALSLNGSKQWANWQQLSQFGVQHCALTPRQLNQIRHDLDEAITQGRRALFQLAQTRESFNPIAKKMELVWMQAYRQL